MQSGKEIMKQIEDFFSEVMSKAARMKMSRNMKQKAKQIAKKKAISLKRKASPEKLKLRSVKKAREILMKKILKDKSKSDLSIAGRETLEKKLNKKKAVIQKIAKKLMPKIKKAETERLAKLRGGEE
jgi:protein subunit release factor A